MRAYPSQWCLFVFVATQHTWTTPWGGNSTLREDAHSTVDMCVLSAVQRVLPAASATNTALLLLVCASCGALFHVYFVYLFAFKIYARWRSVRFVLQAGTWCLWEQFRSTAPPVLLLLSLRVKGRSLRVFLFLYELCACSICALSAVAASCVVFRVFQKCVLFFCWCFSLL